MEIKVSPFIQVQVLENGRLPTKAHLSDAGYDLYATDDFVVKPGQVLKHPLNIKLELPESSYAEITSKSGNGSKGLLVYAGIIDEGYRGVINVVMTNVLRPTLWDRIKNFNKVDKPWNLKFKKGLKLAQLICHPFASGYVLMQVEAINENTSRGSGGFGSSGKSLV